ncbi:MAG TPA: SoxR reducing system RseC family protein [Gallionella sp.]|nr:SoxR reducing system RseC family protein [Gallionella sp.]
MTLETRATVVRVEGAVSFVEAVQTGSCGQCSGKGCGTAKLSQAFCREPRQFKVDNPIGAKVGDQVVVSVADGAVLRGIGLVYLLPLALLVGGAALGNAVAATDGLRDGYAAAGGASGLIAGFLLSRWLDSMQSGRLPCIVRQWRDD